VSQQRPLGGAAFLVRQPEEKPLEELIANAGSTEERIDMVRNLDPASHETVLLDIAGDPNQETSLRYAAITHGLRGKRVLSSDWAMIAIRTDILLVASAVIAQADPGILYLIARDARLDNTQALAIGRLGFLRGP
jgi:hypothetical protein